jgi:hypothetical protein
MVVVPVATLIVFPTEFTSNLATTATFLPVVAALAISIDHPPQYLAIPAVLAASWAFMMPVATPPMATSTEPHRRHQSGSQPAPTVSAADLKTSPRTRPGRSNALPRAGTAASPRADAADNPAAR